MSTQRSTAGLLAVLLVLSSVAGTARADTAATAVTEYTRRIKVGETIQPLGETPFGESISLYTGNLSFRQTDISLPGIGPDITLTRTYEITGSTLSNSYDLRMGDWDLAVPEITTLVPSKKVREIGTWRVEDWTAPTARCSHIAAVTHAPYGFSLPWWHGYQLVTGDGNSQPLLKRTAENANAPGGNVAAYPVLTPGSWVLGCLPSTSNGEEGEGFLGVSPDGTRYWFDHLAYGARVETLIDMTTWQNDPNDPLPIDSAVAGDDSSTISMAVPEEYDPNSCNCAVVEYLPRLTGHMFATRVEDRFGNWVTYRYTADKLQEINASDGRHVLVIWRTDAPLVDKIKVMPGTASERVWTYQYQNPTDRLTRRLTGVVQPDNTSWSFDMGSASGVDLPPVDAEGLCGTRTFTQLDSDDNWVGILITHPTGLEGYFSLSLRARARSWVPTGCVQLQGTLNAYSEPLPPVYLSLALTSKTFSGPGVAPRTWSYRYSPARGSTATECAATPCQDWQWVEVTDPELSTTHYRYSTHWGYMEGKLLFKVDGVTAPGTDDPTGLQKESYTYVNPVMSSVYPSRIGTSLVDTVATANNEPTERMAPESLRTKDLQGVRFQRETLAFDRYGQPETVRRASIPGDSRMETTTYWPVDSQWVLGQAWKSFQDGKLTSQTDYDTRVLPLRTYSFGLLQATYGYASNGQLASITDPRTYVTNLSDHKRGIPQMIRFPDATTIAPTVDDLGQVTAVRNQLNDTMTYRYDSMGRLEQTTFAGGDSVAWNPVNRSFARVGFPQFGLPWGHWKQEVRTGSALTTTLFDALWQPRITITEDTATGSKSYAIKRFDGDGREIYSSYPVATPPTVDDELPGTRTTYDPLGRVATVRQDSELGILTTLTEYLPGFRTRVTNPRNFATTTAYQTFDEPSEDAPTRIEAPLGVTTVITRDAYGKPLAITRSGPVN